MNDQILQTPNTMRILNPYRYDYLDSLITSLSPTVWYAARKETSYSNGNKIPTLTDFSGNGYHATNAAPATQPTYVSSGIGSIPAVEFLGAQFLVNAAFSSAQPNEIYIVLKLNLNTAGVSFIAVDSNNAANRHILFKTSVTDSYSIQAGTRLDDGSSNLNAHVIYGVYNGVSSIISVDGTDTSGDAGAQSMNGITLGARYDQALLFLVGQISEVVIFNSSVSAGNRTLLKTALGSKYGITVV